MLSASEYLNRAGSSNLQPDLWRKKVKSLCLEQQPLFIGLSAGSESTTCPLSSP